MVHVGIFTEEDLINKKDKKDIERLQKIFPHLKYIFSKCIYKNKKIVGLSIYLTEVE